MRTFSCLCAVVVTVMLLLLPVKIGTSTEFHWVWTPQAACPLDLPRLAIDIAGVVLVWAFVRTPIRL